MISKPKSQPSIGTTILAPLVSSKYPGKKKPIIFVYLLDFSLTEIRVTDQTGNMGPQGKTCAYWKPWEKDTEGQRHHNIFALSLWV